MRIAINLANYFQKRELPLISQITFKNEKFH